MHLGHAGPSGLVSIVTEWIDYNGDDGDLQRIARGLSSEISHFAIHSMGWIRRVRIGNVHEYTFDTRSVDIGALQRLAHDIRKNGYLPPWKAPVVSIAVHSEQGVYQASDTHPGRLLSLVLKCMEVVKPQLTLDVINRQRLNANGIDALPDLTVSNVMTAWRADQKTMGENVSRIFSRPDYHNPRSAQSIKLLSPRGDSFVFEKYIASPSKTLAPWSSERSRNFEGKLIDAVVPDIGTAQSVIKSSFLALEAREPVLELCGGMILSSSGFREYCWHRVSLPIDMPSGDKAVLTVLSLKDNIPDSVRQETYDNADTAEKPTSTNRE